MADSSLFPLPKAVPMPSAGYWLSQLDPGNTLATAQPITVFNLAQSQQVSPCDPTDIYQFTVAQTGIFTATLQGLTGDADIRLIRDANGDGNFLDDPGEILAWQWERGTNSETIRCFLSPGTYYLDVSNYNRQTVHYSFTTNFTPADSDPRQFSIQVNLASGLEGLSTAALTAITDAVHYWEEVIAASPFEGPQILPITLVGAFSTEDYLAFGGPSALGYDANGHIMPTAGNTTLNTRYLEWYNQNPSALASLMRHEFAHVLGFGTLWNYYPELDPSRRLVDTATATYRADTYAGWAYGELVGTYRQTAVPVDTATWQHWDETTFDQELLTPFTETSGISEPLSQLTIAALRDLGWTVNYGAAQSYSLPTG